MDFLIYILCGTCGAVAALVSYILIRKRLLKGQKEDMIMLAEIEAKDIILKAKKQIHQLENEHEQHINAKNKQISDIENTLKQMGDTLNQLIADLESKNKKADDINRILNANVKIATKKYVEYENLKQAFIKQVETIAEMSDAEAMNKFIEDIKARSKTQDSNMVIHYGQVRTMADILFGLNEVHHFSNCDDAINHVQNYIASQSQDHCSISAMAFQIIADTLKAPLTFINGKLNDDEIKRLFQETVFQNSWENALYKYHMAKLWKLICYFNDFRRYSSPDEIIEDLQSVGLESDYFKMTRFPWFFFSGAVRNAWKTLAPDGYLNSTLLEEYMFANHETSLKTIGLEATIQQHFKSDGPCHPDVYFPAKFGSAPVYVERNEGNQRRYIKSCGEGKGYNYYPEAFEMRYAEKLLFRDPRYKIIHGNFGTYFIPIEDMSLPIYGTYEGKVVFENEIQRSSYIKNIIDEDIRKRHIYQKDRV